MILAIAGVAYHAARIDPHESGTVAVRLTKPDGTAYDLVRTHHGTVDCDCPDFVCRRLFTAGLCKHGRACVAAGLIPAPAPVPNLPPRDLAAARFRGNVSPRDISPATWTRG